MLNSWLASLRCVDHKSPSTLNMPQPRRSPRNSVRGFLLGKFAKFVLRMCSTLNGFPVTTVRRAPILCTTIVCDGEPERRLAYQSRRLCSFL
ncbi:hypothetical protein EV1_015101 [Malus domestica]